jgi:hypothetical protein
MKVGCLENKGLVIGGGSKKMFNIWYLSPTAPISNDRSITDKMI